MRLRELVRKLGDGQRVIKVEWMLRVLRKPFLRLANYHWWNGFFLLNFFYEYGVFDLWPENGFNVFLLCRKDLRFENNLNIQWINIYANKGSSDYNLHSDTLTHAWSGNTKFGCFRQIVYNLFRQLMIR